MRADRFQIYGEGAWNPEMLSLPCCSAQIPGQRGRLILPPQVNGTSHLQPRASRSSIVLLWLLLELLNLQIALKLW